MVLVVAMESQEAKSINWNRIKVLLLDSDGVLTDGGVYLPESGENELRRFSIKDGFGITRLLSTGFPIAVISRSPSTPVRVRCERLGITQVHLGIQNKVEQAGKVIESLGLSWAETAFMGDDVPDLDLLRTVGLSLAPADAANEVIREVDWVSQFPGGHGAVREVCDSIFFATER